MTNKEFWNKLKHFLTNKGCFPGPESIPMKFIKPSANVIHRHFHKIIHKDIDLNVRPIFKKMRKLK